MKIKILGTGCPNCIRLKENTKKDLKELSKKAEVENVTDITKIMSYGIMSTPAAMEYATLYSNKNDIKKFLRII